MEKQDTYRSGDDLNAAENPYDEGATDAKEASKPSWGAPSPPAVTSAPPPPPPSAAVASFAPMATAVANTSASIQKAVEKGASYLTSNTPRVLLFIVGAALFAFGVAMVLRWIITRAVVGRKGQLLAETKVPSLGTEYKRVSGRDIPNVGNGKRMTMCFWIYVHDPERYKGTYRHVLHRGEDNVDGTTSPVVFLDKDSTRLHIMFAKNTSPVSVTMAKPFPATGTTGTTKGNTFLEDRGITIDYVPIQRWVHVAIVVNEEVSGGSITAYVDSELVKVNAGNIQNTTGKGDVQNLNLDRKGDIYIGGSLTSSNGPGFSGLVGKVQFFNHDLNSKDIYDVYAEGPVDGFLAKAGFGAYGVRSPVYRLG